MLFSDKDLRRLIFPLIIEQILAIGVGMVDTMMISYAGEAAISGVSLVDMVNNLLINIFSAVSTGGAVIVSQYLGRHDRDSACHAAGQLITLTALVSSGIAGLSLISRRPLLRLLFGAIEDDVMDSALIYFRISAYSYPFLALYNSCAALFRSMGNSRISMFVSIGMNVCNACGNALLMFGFHMGVAGAAYASLLARAGAAAVMFLLLRNERQDIVLRRDTIFTWNGSLLGKIVYIAAPSGIENGIFQLGRVLVVSIIAGFGTVQIAANAVANNLDSLGCLAGQAMNLAMITVIGQCLGAGRPDQAVYYAKKLLKITYAAMIAENLLIFASLHWVLNVYSLSPEARKLAVLLILIHDGFAMLIWPPSFTLPNCLRAGGDVRYTMTVSVFSMFVFRVFFSYIFGTRFGMGAVGVWIAMLLDWIFRDICFILRFRRGKWKTIKVI